MEKKEKNIFVEGPISAAFITDSIQKHSTKTSIGAHSIFLGQVRADDINGETVTGIEYTTYEALALSTMHSLREQIFATYPLTCLHVYHSLGLVPTGEICLFVFASSPHRKVAIEACNETVEKIKELLPIWGREITTGGNQYWKQNQTA